jgi:hypothetical protein
MVLFRGLFSVIGSPSNVGFSSSLCSSTESQVMSASALLHRFWLLCATSCSSLLTGDESEDEENMRWKENLENREEDDDEEFTNVMQWVMHTLLLLAQGEVVVPLREENRTSISPELPRMGAP